MTVCGSINILVVQKLPEHLEKIMLIQIDNTVLNTDKIVKIDVDENGRYVIVYYSQEFYDRFEFPHHESQRSFLKKIGLNTFFA